MTGARASVRHFENIDEVLAVLEQDVESDEIRKYFFWLDDVDYLWTAEGNLIPSIAAPFASPFLYRGQVTRHQPCVPGVFRGLDQVGHPQELPPSQRARCFADRVRLEEFLLALDEHPACHYSCEIGLRVQPYAIAQHYELATDRIDLTQDHRVAAFFATNSRRDGKWRPVCEGNGVLYRLRRSVFAHHVPDDLECIGKQALPRPGEQKAYTLRFPLGNDLENLPIEIYTFAHDESCGQRLNDWFDSGVALFPPDVMAEVADAIKSAASLPEEIVKRLLGAAELPEEILSHVLIEIKMALKEHLDIHVSTRKPIVMNTSQRARALVAVEAMRADFLRGVAVLAVRDAGFEA